MKSIIQISAIGVILLLASVQNQLHAHAEWVANLTVEQTENGLEVTAILEKKHLTYALNAEAKCSPKDMLSVCANQYFQDHISMSINGKKVKLAKESQQLTKSSLIIKYNIPFKENIKKVDIQSDYMIKYNDHSKVKVVSKLTSKIVTYSLSAKKKQISISL